MDKRFWIIVAAFIALGAVLVFSATQQGTAVVLMPSELSARRGAGDISRIRVAGRVAELPVEYVLEPETELRFSIRDPGSGQGEALPVVYNGLRPDMFAPGRDVIIDGDLRGGTLRATKLLTQCPSKYEPPVPVGSAGAHGY